MDLNRIMIIGRLTKDPYAPSADFTAFEIAVNDPYKKDAPPLYVKIKTFKKTADVAAKYLKKGSMVLVDGRLTVDEWEKDGIKRTSPAINADSISLGPKPSDRQEPQPRPQEGPSRGSRQEARREEDQFEGGGDDDSGLPF